MLVTFADRVAGWALAIISGQADTPFHTPGSQTQNRAICAALVRLSGQSSACVFGIYVELFVGDGLLVTLCHRGQAFLAAIGEVWRRSCLG